MESVALRKIEVLGPGCARCKQTFRVVSELVEAERLPFEVVKVESMERIVQLGILATPAVAVEGRVVLSGRVPKADDLRPLLAKA